MVERQVTLLFLLLLFLLTGAVVEDLRRAKIPNRLTLSAFCLALLIHGSYHGMRGLLFSLGGAAAGTALLLIPYALGGVGAGDAKLLGAVGAILGARGVFEAFLWAAAAGGLYAIAALAAKGLLSSTVRRYWLMLLSTAGSGKASYYPPTEKESKLKIRYGVAIAGGTLVSIAADSASPVNPIEVLRGLLS